MYTACTAEPRPAARRSRAAHSVRYDPCKKRPRGQSVRSTPHRRLIRNQLRQNGARHVCRGTVFHGASLPAAQLYIIIYSLHCETPSRSLTRTRSCPARRGTVMGMAGNAERPASAPKIGGTPTNAYGKSANGAPARGSPFEAKSLSIGKACRSRPPFGKCFWNRRPRRAGDADSPPRQVSGPHKPRDENRGASKALCQSSAQIRLGARPPNRQGADTPPLLTAGTHKASL